MSEEIPKAGLTETATEEINLANETDEKLERNDRDWQNELQRLSDTPAPAPSPSSSSRSMDMHSIKAEYDAGLTRYQQKQDAIINESSLDRATIRENGTTLESEFQDAKTPQLEFDFQQEVNNSQQLNTNFTTQSIQGSGQQNSEGRSR